MRYDIKREISFFVLLIGVFVNTPFAQARKLDITDVVPAFSVIDSAGLKYDYTADKKQVLLVAFISPFKSQSHNALSDLERMVGSIEVDPNALTVIYVVDEPNSLSSLDIQLPSENGRAEKHVVLDSDYQLWGKFGVIASPTVFLIGTDGTIATVKAGHGYDFAPVIKSSLLKELGVSKGDSGADASQVRTIDNDSVAKKAFRHFKLAKMLQEKQQYEGAVKQLEQAVQIDPNSTEIILELGGLYCKTLKPQKAIDLVKDSDISQTQQKAVCCFILGKAHFLLEEYDSAQDFLRESIQFDPSSSEAFYLLGRIYHIQNKSKEALQAYYTSLQLIYGSYD